MRIMGLDLATNTGWCLGAPDERPRVDTKRLMTKSDVVEVAAENLGRFIRDVCFIESERPDLIVYEAPISPFAGHADQRQRSIESIVMPPELVGAVRGGAACYGIRCIGAHAATIRKHLIGRANMAGRDATKNAVIDRCHVLKLLPPSCRNDNMADACAVWEYACAKYARKRSAELILFGERAA